jgi:hypothetical protein
VRVAFLTERLTITAFARSQGRTREAIAGCLTGPEFDALRDEMNLQAKIAMARLHGAVGDAADAGAESLSIAGRRATIGRPRTSCCTRR